MVNHCCKLLKKSFSIQRRENLLPLADEVCGKLFEYFVLLNYLSVIILITYGNAGATETHSLREISEHSRMSK